VATVPFLTIKLLKMDFSKNKVLTFEQGCKYLGYAKSTCYKLTSAGILPHSKPNGGSIFFEREKLEAWMLSNAKSSRAEKLIAAATYVKTKK
jgi:excisionase family DNA binding protein